MPPVPKKEPLEWKDAVFVLKYSQDGKGYTRSVPCKVKGGLCVHVSVNPGLRQFAVSSVHTGLWLADCGTELDCVRVADDLLERCRFAFDHRTPSAIVGRLPPWVLRWLRRVRESRKYLHPSVVKGEP